MDRCSNPKNPQFKDYGGRGIENRFSSAEHFIKWVLKELPHPDYRRVHLDRTNNDGHYEQGNLQLSTPRENLRHTTRTMTLQFEGKAWGLPELHVHLLKNVVKFDLTEGQFRLLVRRGKSVAQILSEFMT